MLALKKVSNVVKRAFKKLVSFFKNFFFFVNAIINLIKVVNYESFLETSVSTANNTSLPQKKIRSHAKHSRLLRTHREPSHYHRRADRFISRAKKKNPQKLEANLELKRASRRQQQQQKKISHVLTLTSLTLPFRPTCLIITHTRTHSPARIAMTQWRSENNRSRSLIQCFALVQ